MASAMSKRSRRLEARKRAGASGPGRKHKPSRRPVSRRVSLFLALVLVAFLAAWALAGSYFVHHSRKWIDSKIEVLPSFVSSALLWIGSPVGDFLDSLGITGHDAVYEYDEAAPAGSVVFAGIPVRTGPPAPADITVRDFGEFKVGWSPSLRHPVWVAYHVPRDAKYPLLSRPGFMRDPSAKHSPQAYAYSSSGYDRGHMAPNFAIATRFGRDAQRSTFYMSNIAPQTPALNRGVWRDVEHRIAEFWTARYGEIWVVVGSIPSPDGDRIGYTGIDIPTAFWQVVVAQEGMDVRALALVYSQDVPRNFWPSRGLVTIDELEEMTGLDFLPSLPEFIQAPLEAELPSRLWPVKMLDAFRMVAQRFIDPYDEGKSSGKTSKNLGNQQ